MLILSPGPANISERVRSKLTLPDIGHRDIEFSELLHTCRSLVLELCNVKNDYQSVVINGSGTAAIESVVSAVNGSMQGILVLSNGVYGTRAAEIARVYGVSCDEVGFDWTQPIDLQRVTEAIQQTKNDVVYIVHHETTTGMLNPLGTVANIAKDYGKWVFVDAISSVGGEVLNLNDLPVDLIVGSSNKCIRGVPGISFIVLSNDVVDVFSNRRRVLYYNDLLNHLTLEDGGQTPFTPPIQVMYAFREALLELIEEGLQNRISNYRKIADLLRDNIAELGLKLLFDRGLYSNTMTSVIIPEGLSYSVLHDRLREMEFLIYKSQGKIASNTFRIGTVGLIAETDIMGFSNALGQVIS